MKKPDKLLIFAIILSLLLTAAWYAPRWQELTASACKSLIKSEIYSYQKSFFINHFTISGYLKSRSSQNAAPQKSISLEQTDDDIKALIAAEKKELAGKEKAGNIIERTLVDMSSQEQYDNIKVQNRTEQKIDIKASLQKGADLKISDKSKPCILIYHTHTTESYTLLDNGWYPKGMPACIDDEKRNVVRVGDAICEQLEKAGFNVIHDRSVHDTDYTNAYKHSGAAIDKILKENPEIDVTIDIHRDSIGADNENDRTAAVNTINGKKAAQLMIITGCEEGDITDFPNWQDNFNFTIGLQKQLEDMYPGIMRPVFFSERRYNMYKTKNSVLIEVGADGNTLEQAVYSGKLLGIALSEYLEKYVEK